MKSNWLVSYGGCSIDNLSHNLWIGVQGSQHGLLHFSEGVLLMLNFLLPRVSQSHSLKVVSSYLISNPRTAFCYHHPSYSQSKSLTLHLELKMANMMKLAYNIAKVLNLQYICWQCASKFFFNSLYYLWCVVELIAIVISTLNELFFVFVFVSPHVLLL
jgi:hypothetical protein